MRQNSKGGLKRLFAGALFALFAMLFLITKNQSMVLVIALKPLCSVCSSVAVSSDTRYHIPAILQVLVNKIEKRHNSDVSNSW